MQKKQTASIKRELYVDGFGDMNALKLMQQASAQKRN